MYTDVTKSPAVMWGPFIIGFGMLDYAYASGRTGIMPAAGFSPRKANLTFYVGDAFAGAAQLYEKLGKHKKSVACLYINKLDGVNLEVMRAIIAADFAHAMRKN